MNIFFVHPELTVGGDPLAHSFYDACRKEAQEHLSVALLSTESAVAAARPSGGDAVVLFNRADQQYSDALLTFLEDAVQAGVEIFPVALSSGMRQPPSVAHSRQNFDLVDALRRRSLDPSFISTVATDFARSIVCRLQPTLSKERMRLFISYRRVDGEDIAAAFDRAIRVRAEQAFRDLIDIHTGANAQAVIEENLSKSDAVVFLDTPLAGESPWIARELELALSYNLPIVWVRIGPTSRRPNLTVRPADRPHFDLPDLTVSALDAKPTLVDDVLQAAFRISRAGAQTVFDRIRRLRQIAKSAGAQVSEIDKRRLLYLVYVPRKGFRYPQRSMTHLIQFYGRWPKDEDEILFNSCASEAGYEPHPQHGPYYDAALLLGPIPGQTVIEEKGRLYYVDSAEEYVRTLEAHLAPEKPKGRKPRRKGLIISGAFPDCEPEHQQHLTDAVHAFVLATLNRRGTVIFGGHPTFSPLVFDLSRRVLGPKARKAVHLYLSRFFVSDAELKDYRKKATARATDAVAGDRNASLSEMRKAMIADGEAAGLVAMGGKTKAGGHSPGVDEEIEMARAADLPVFIIGSAGGRAAEIGAQLKAAGWKDKYNKLSDGENEELRTSLDYGVLANRILGAIGL